MIELDNKIVELKRLKNSKDEIGQLQVVFDGCLKRKVGFENLTYKI